MNPVQFYKALADDTRLRCLLLLLQQELCVCDLTSALQLSQPKISRHLALLRQNGLLTDRRQGQWVYYRLSESLPDWARQVLSGTALHQQAFIADNLARLAALGDQNARRQRCDPAQENGN